MKNYNTIIILAASFLSLSAIAEAEISGKIKQETSQFTKGGTTIGATQNHQKDIFKSQTEARLFFDGDLTEADNAPTYHLELLGIDDSKAESNYNSHKLYTQRDFLREAYIDIDINDWSLRLGKQQVAWGTADGIKLLDLINPTDYSELNQNSPEDARIPIWMINAEKDLADGSNVQVIVSQPRENIFAGLNRDINTSVRGNDLANAGPQGIPDIVGIGHNKGHPFILKGVDTITGQRNGFLNIAPDLGTVAAGFGANFLPLGMQGFGGLNSGANPLVNHFTVGAFTSGASLADLNTGFMNLQQAAGVPADMRVGFDNLNFGQTVAGLACQNPQYTAGSSPGAAQCANLGNPLTAQAAVTAIFAEVGGQFTGAQVLDTFGQGYDSNLSTYANNDGDNSAFEYMKLASFATFDTFVNARSQYTFDMPDDADVDFAMRFKQSLDSGLNYSLNYSYNYDANPRINLSWRNDAGEVLKKKVVEVSTPIQTPQGAATLVGRHIELTDSQNNQYGGANNRSAILTFEQTLERAHNIGGSLDFAVDTDNFGAVVLRAEALYQKDVYQPIIDKSRLSFGDLTDALKMIPGDRLKYVLGVDFTVATNLLISTQFIQDRNLDFVDGKGELDTECQASVAQHNAPPAQGGSGLSLNADEICARYTGDFASMHLTNGLLKAEENKNFYSLFLSKPFGSSQQHRWNNIIIFEDQGSGGKWNRFDVEYAFADDVIGTFEWNRYWGEENSQFGQLEKSSNIQLGLQYTF